MLVYLICLFCPDGWVSSSPKPDVTVLAQRQGPWAGPTLCPRWGTTAKGLLLSGAGAWATPGAFLSTVRNRFCRRGPWGLGCLRDPVSRGHCDHEPRCIWGREPPSPGGAPLHHSPAGFSTSERVLPGAPRSVQELEMTSAKSSSPSGHGGAETPIPPRSAEPGPARHVHKQQPTHRASLRPGGGLPPWPPRLRPGQAPGSWLRVPVDGKILMGFKLISWD